MARTVNLPPVEPLCADGAASAGWWHDDPGTDRIVCHLCPRACRLKPGDRGFCFVRQNRDGAMVLTTYGRSTGFCIDPIEKKPLNHFYPGTSVLSFGTAGCNLGCQFCQNWDISRSRAVERASARATPAAIAQAALDHGCRSVAFTYNDPTVWAEYAIDTARECRRLGVKTVAVTAGYISPAARAPFFEAFDAANIDLKAFTEEFYRDIVYAHLQPVLDTIAWLKAETGVWIELTNLVIPGLNDDPDQIARLCEWVLAHAGEDTPLHFSAFHPDFRMRDRPATTPETLRVAHEIARRAGLKYVYTGNVHDPARQSTCCPACGALLIERDWYEIVACAMDGNRCGRCGQTIAGHFDAVAGNWGRRRQPIRIEPVDLQEKTQSAAVDLRPPTAAGRFYPAEPRAMNRLVDRLLATAPRQAEHWAAALVPHAGLTYSGRVAAQVFQRLAIPARVIVVGPKHTPRGRDGGVSPFDAWQIPGGSVPADPELARALAREVPGLCLDSEAHRDEHAIEVELPFLARLAPESRVVGIVLGAGSWPRAQAIAAGLSTVIASLDEPPLLIVSSDMNHFAPDDENRRLDAVAIAAMQLLEPERFLEAVRKRGVSMCGAFPAAVVMETLRRLGRLNHCELVDYATSADAGGPIDRVVGYAGLLLG